MIRGKTSALLLGAVMVFCLSLLAPASAQAYCVYNDTNVKLHVCTGRCLGCLTTYIDPGGHACCPGGDRGCGGSTLVRFSLNYGAVNCGGWDVRYTVDAHGWVSIHGNVPTTFNKCLDDPDKVVQEMTVMVYNSDGTLDYQGHPQNTDYDCP